MNKLKLLILFLLMPVVVFGWSTTRFGVGNYGIDRFSTGNFGYSIGNIFSGTLSQLNTDVNFEGITTGTSYEISEVTAADPAVVTFAGGAELATGTLDNDSYYVITATQADHFYNGCAITDRFLGSTAVNSQALDANNKVKLLHDFETNDNLVLSGVSTAESLGTELITASDDRDFTTYGNVNWIGYSGGVVADGTGKLQVTMNGSGDCGTRLLYPNIGGSAENGKWFEVKADVWQGTTATTSFIITYGTNAVGESITISGSQTTFTVHVLCDEDNADIKIFGQASDSGTFFVDDVSLKQIYPTNGTISRISAIDGDGVCTIERDFSDLAAAITSAYGATADFTNYTAGDGWLPGNTINPEINNDTLLTDGTIYFIVQNDTGDFFYTGSKIGDFFESAGTETPNGTNTVVEVTDTFALNDNSQSAVTTLLSDEFTILNGWGYKFITTVDAIDAGSVTPIAGTGYGEAITTTVTEDTQNVKGLTDGGYAGLEASTAADGAKITELIIYRYGDL